MNENMNELNEIKINVLEERELTLEESEKVAGGTPIRFRDKSRFKERSTKLGGGLLCSSHP